MPNGQTYNQYTRCIPAASYSGLYFTTGWGTGGFVGAIVLLVAVFILSPGASIALAVSIGIGYCVWWLYHRLVCLGQPNACMIGLVVRQDKPENKTFPDSIDSDYTLYLLPAPYPLIGNTLWYQNMDNPAYPQGSFMRDQASFAPPPPDPAYAQMRKTYTEQQTTEGPTPLFRLPRSR